MLAGHVTNATLHPCPLPDNPAHTAIDFSSELLQGFIKHPRRFPLQYKKLRFWERTKLDTSRPSNIGLTFHTEQYHKPGSILEITIPTRKDTHCFPAKVVAIKETDEGYDTGVWLVNADDAPRLRIVEQICHIELYLNDKKYKEGPFLSSEKITEEWIGKFAGQFPVN